MNNLLPRSLFSRLVLVLLGGLVIAQVLSLAIQLYERGQLLSRASGVQSAQRIADIVKVLEPLTSEDRRKMIGILSAPPLLISLGGIAARPTKSDPARSAHAALFETMLRRFLADAWPVTVALTDSPPWMPPAAMKEFKAKGTHEGMRFGPAMHAFAQPGISFLAQVQLHDGTLVSFDSRQAPETLNWPYRLLLSIGILLGAVIAVSLIAVRWATQPLKALADAAEELGKNINRAPLPESGPLEVERAARALNTMQARLIGYIQSRTRVLAAMSHDLKTPITRLRLRSELLEDPQLRSKFARDLEDMEAMVSGTLDFMRGLDNEEPVQPIDINALVQTLAADVQETGGTVQVTGAALKPYAGRPRALKRCLANLLDNAIKYGKSAHVVIDDHEDRLELRVQDEGPGIADAALEQVFESFYRLEPSRNRETGGTGLGLTIARSIAEAHRGTLIVRNRPNAGLEAILSLPRVSAA
jgi:signal transduction histidine kinase